MCTMEYTCRICLVENVLEGINLSSLLETEYTTYLDCFRACTHLDVNANDHLPQTVCKKCADQLKDAYLFIKRAKESHLILMKNQNIDLIGDKNLQKIDFEWVSVQKDIVRIPPANISHALKKGVYELRVCPEYDVASESDSVLEIFDSPVIDLHTKRKRDRPNTDPKFSEESPSLKTENMIKCEYCDRDIIAEKLKMHIARNHKFQMFLCHSCPSTFKDARSLKQHTETHKNNRSRDYICESCGRKFFTKATFQNHTKIHDIKREPVFQCKRCDKSFFHKGSLKVHMQHHIGDTIDCEICSKKYVRAIDLEIHLRSHSGHTPFKCQYCEKSFTQMGTLNKHEKHHEGYRYKCNICPKEYLHQSTLITHRKEHTGFPLKCSICDKGFVKKSKIRRHIGAVHKIKEIEEIDRLIIQVKITREYRGRVLKAS